MKINYKGASQTLDYQYKCNQCSTVLTKKFSMRDMQSEVLCDCGGTAPRYIAKVNFALDPISGDHLIATEKWIKHREKVMAKEKKNMENHGTYK